MFLKRLAAHEKPLSSAAIKAKDAPYAIDGIKHKLPVIPILGIATINENWRPANSAQQNIHVTDAQFPNQEAHRIRSVGVAAFMMDADLTVFALKSFKQGQRGICGSYMPVRACPCCGIFDVKT